MIVGGVDIRPGFRVLDIATGTGLLAMMVAQRVGAAGEVIGIDLSKGMLDQARAKAELAGLHNIHFMLGGAEQMDFRHESFDLAFCASAIVLMHDIPLSLHHWSKFLKPGGTVSFDTPAKPFGISQMVAEIAASYGVHLLYADVADTPDKCRAVLEKAGYEVVAVRTEFADRAPIELGKAIAFWDEHIDHPAWRSLHQASTATRNAIRSEYVDKIIASAVNGTSASDENRNEV